jgi:predicted nucleotidyltransferase
MTVEELLESKRGEILKVAARYGAHNVRVFGSAARGEADPESDIDILVDLENPWTLLDHIGMKQELEDLLGRKVDVIVADALREIVRDHALREAVPL